MGSLTLKWDKKSFNGCDVFYIVCTKYGTVGVVEGNLLDNNDLYISWLYIEPFFRLKNGVKILMQLLRKEIPFSNINNITYNCPKRRNKHIGSSLDDFLAENGIE